MAVHEQRLLNFAANNFIGSIMDVSHTAWNFIKELLVITKPPTIYTFHIEVGDKIQIMSRVTLYYSGSLWEIQNYAIFSN